MGREEFINQEWVKKEIINRFNYNPKTGSLTWAPRDCKQFDQSKIGQEVGYITKQKDGYVYKRVRLEVKGRVVHLLAPRLCWLVYTGDWPKHTIDHINRDSLDNRWENLRDVTQKVNNSNRGFYKNSPLHHTIFHNGFWKVRFYGKVVYQSRCVGKALKERNQRMKQNA